MRNTFYLSAQLIVTEAMLLERFSAPLFTQPTGCRHRFGVVRSQLLSDESEGRDPPWRTPPPKGIPEDSLADRRGPFWTSLGEPDEITGERPGFLLRNDWHISSIMTKEELLEEEQKLLQAEREDQGQEEEDDDAAGRFAKYMEFEESVVPARKHKVSPYPMPGNWQEYQALQSQVSIVLEHAEATAKERKEAESYLKDMAEGYDRFKAILAEKCSHRPSARDRCRPSG